MVAIIRRDTNVPPLAGTPLAFLNAIRTTLGDGEYREMVCGEEGRCGEHHVCFSSLETRGGLDGHGLGGTVAEHGGSAGYTRSFSGGVRVGRWLDIRAQQLATSRC